jgi:hypothetical protein
LKRGGSSAILKYNCSRVALMAAIFCQKDYFSAEKSSEFTKSHRIPVMDSFNAAVITPERRNRASAITAKEYFKIYCGTGRQILSVSSSGFIAVKSSSSFFD